MILVAVSAWGAYALRFDWLFSLYRDEFPVFLACVLLVKPLTFYTFGLYRRYWRYASLWDLIAVVFAASAATILVAAIMAGLRVFDLISGFPRTVVPIDWLLTMTFTGGVRMSVRVVAEMRTDGIGAPTTKRVLVVGAGNAGVMVVREMQRNPQLGMEPVGFLDDSTVKKGKTILGVRVLGGLETLAEQAAATKATEVIVAIPTAPGTVVRAIAERCRAAELRSRVIPGVFELLDGKASISRLRSVEISDLLRRAQVEVALSGRQYVRNRTVLVTGAGGSIGSELCRQVARDLPRRLILFGHGENSVYDIHSELRAAFPQIEVLACIGDVRDRARLQQIFARVQPEVLFHAAAHKHVPLMEDNPEEAITNNVVGTSNVVECAAESGVDRLVMISTDKAVAPTNVMGASKRVAEMIVRRTARNHGRRFAVVRFGNVLGSRGSVVPVFKAQIESGGPITVTHPDVQRFFMTIPEAVHLALEAGGHAEGGELFVLNMGSPVRIVDLAEDLIQLSGLSRGEIEIQFTGLRPGEKLDEKLWEDGAVVKPTPTADVLSVLEQESGLGVDFPLAIGRLESAARSGDVLELQHCLAEIIPTFAPTPVGQV